MASRRITAQEIDELRMPPSVFGGDPRGAVDPAALLAASWGTPYDVDARRAAIAKALLAQQLAAAAPTTARDAAGMGTRSIDYKDTAQGTSIGDSPAATGQTPGYVTQTTFPSNIPDLFEQGRPPAPNDRRGFADDEALSDEEADAITAAVNQSMEDMNAVGRAISENAPAAPPGGYPGEHSDIPSAPTPTAPTPDTVTPTTPDVTKSGIPAGERSPSMFADQVPGDVPSSGNLFAGTPGFNTFGGLVTPGGRGYSGEHGDIPGATPSGSPGLPAGMPGGPISAGMGQQGFNAGKGGLALGGTGAILGDTSKGWGGLATTPSGSFVSTATTAPDKGKGDTMSEADEDAALADLGASMQAMNAISQAMPGAPPAAPSDYDFTDNSGKGPFDPGGPGYSPGAALTAGTQTATGPLAGSGYGGWGGFSGSGLADMLGAMTGQGMPSPGGGAFSSGFNASTESLADQAGLSDIGSQSLADQAGLSDIGVDTTGGGGAAGGSGGFGGMGATGAVGGMSTGGTGEIGSVAGGGPSGTGGMAGAGMGGGIGMGMSEGAMAAAADAAAAAASDAAAAAGDGDGSGDGNGGDGNGGGSDY